MLWPALIVLAVSAIAAATGHIYPGGFGLGTGLLALWYFTEREPDLPPATAEELTAFPDAFHEASTHFDASHLPEFLHQIAPRFNRGFGDREISQLLTIAGRLRHLRESQSEFQITYQDIEAPLRVRLFKDDASSVAIYFFSSSSVVEMLDEEMDRFFQERGI